MPASTSTLPSSANNKTARHVKCLLVEPIRMRVATELTTPCSRLARPKPRRYRTLPSCATPTTRPGASLRLNGANRASIAVTGSGASVGAGSSMGSFGWILVLQQWVVQVSGDVAGAQRLGHLDEVALGQPDQHRAEPERAGGDDDQRGQEAGRSIGQPVRHEADRDRSERCQQYGDDRVQRCDARAHVGRAEILQYRRQQVGRGHHHRRLQAEQHVQLPRVRRDQHRQRDRGGQHEADPRHPASAVGAPSRAA